MGGDLVEICLGGVEVDSICPAPASGLETDAICHVAESLGCCCSVF